MKRIKFKNNIFTHKKFYQIVFDQKKSSEIWGGVISKSGERYYPEPKNWTYKEIKFKPIDRNHYFGCPGKPAISYFKGKIKNNKKTGKGLEIILQIQNYLPELVSFYKGNWKNGKKNGKGFWSNYHPLIGECKGIGADNPKYVVKTMHTESSFKGTFKDDEFDRGILNNSKGLFKGAFKKSKLKISNDKKEKRL